MSLKKNLLSFLSRSPGTPYSLKELCRSLKIPRQDTSELVHLLQSLGQQGIVGTDQDGRHSYLTQKPKEKKKEHSGRRIGIIRVTRKGLGFVRVEGEAEEILVSRRWMHNAMHGDRVAVVPFARREGGGQRQQKGPGLEGEVVEILERANSTVVGTLERKRDVYFVVPDDNRIGRDIYVVKDATAKASPGDKVVVQMAPWEDEHLNPEGTIVETLGPSGEVRVEMMSVARSFNLPIGFPPEVMHETERFPARILREELEGRLDYREKTCFTIDPVDAKDFDDAISYEPLGNDTVRLGVHIADVSHYVAEGSLLDAEALKRGTSVYLVNEVIPMLPERLSNNLCSLKPGEDRLTFSVIMDLNGSGTVQNYEIRKSVIHSKRRFTYEEVQTVISGQSGEMKDLLLPLHELTKVLYKKRRKQGSLDFDTPEAKFKFDKQGLPSAIVLKQRLDAHRLVEECMLLANNIVAKHCGVARKEGHPRPFVYRVHDLPNPDRLKELGNFVKQFGFSLNARDGVSSRDLQRLLDQVQGSDVEYVINEVALRSMAKAVYSEKNIGHYGLAFNYYTHFTSPIRRYPDLIVHRLLEEYRHEPGVKRREFLAERLPYLCRQSSDRERVAMEAERASVKVMQVEYMKRHIGDVLDGVIGGVTEYGLFVEIKDLLIEGLIRVRDMEDDYYLFDEKQYTLRGRSRGKVYRLGDKVKVQVISVDPHEQQIDLGFPR